MTVEAEICKGAELAVVVLAAGKGTRMNSDLPKVLHPLAGRPMIGHVLQALEPLAPDRIVVVIGPEMEALQAAVQPHTCVVQEDRLGTGHALRCAHAQLRNWKGQVLVVYGDTPLITADTLAALCAAKARQGAALAALAFRARDPGAYGRIVLDTAGNLLRVVEAVEADAATRAIDLCNAGLLMGDADLLFDLLGDLRNDNSKKEYFLPEVFEMAVGAGQRVAVALAPEEEVQGVNSRAELAAAESVMQQRLRQAALTAGATLEHPDSVYLQADTILEPDAVVEANVVFGPGVIVRGGARIRAFSHIEKAEIARNAVVGPFARIREGSLIGEGARIGNFVETKNTTLEAGAKANHLAYLGDATIGSGANIGAGAITCNYDGFAKHRTEIGAGAFIGSNAALVAPATIGKGAIVGAGSTVGGEIADDELIVTRAPAKRIKEGARRYRETHRKPDNKSGKE
ncbi:bifunctional UDP-N-acetylglucosamine diphosphorylase/glucosamine-1-phosphate N-acetyltransferase GlmU [Limibacillus halophilus]|uniref:Bifunctional protein GlmU n=1 Tax=Limibacillus halophilus TaxID=1579333 RepID=A0A839SW81_9PROT|nr:bifunctional UDP-N-acetylglucosamine diphosphorylase/glucosamine-1-phosphate N-acetyltransferase GlmU [Limibacillus halophilus]MBB3065203.1 bifunctional UDP-N-acetylglucosamine pyrophosphorylase/glucosamine-1-phosphate N-acetyltransferase [Limibacillus halophilus]